MSEGDPIDPYQTPKAEPNTAPIDVVAPPSALRDPRPYGWLAIVAITIQVVGGIISSSIVKTPDVVAFLMMLQVATLLFAAVSFLVWFSVCALNVLRMNPRAAINPVWSACCFFVPFANFVCPVLEMRKLLRGTFPSSGRNRLMAVAIVWWVSFILRGVVLKVGEGTEVLVVWILVSVVSAGCVAALILRISAKQAGFRWSADSGTRVMMQPLGGRRTVLPQRKKVETQYGVK